MRTIYTYVCCKSPDDQLTYYTTRKPRHVDVHNPGVPYVNGPWKGGLPWLAIARTRAEAGGRVHLTDGKFDTEAEAILALVEGK